MIMTVASSPPGTQRRRSSRGRQPPCMYLMCICCHLAPHKLCKVDVHADPGTHNLVHMHLPECD